MNLGYIGALLDDGDIDIKVYYDPNSLLGDAAPLINGPRGFCLDVTNVSGRTAKVTFTLNGTTTTVNLTKGDPSNRSRTAAQMSAAGFTTRGSVQNVTVSLG